MSQTPFNNPDTLATAGYASPWSRLSHKNTSLERWGVLAGILSMVFVMAGIFNVGNIMAPYHLPSWAVLVVYCMLGAIPLLWLKIWNNHRICFYLVSLILLISDTAPALCSPLAVLITTPNFLYQLYLNRDSKIKYFILPFLILGGVYFYNAFLLNYVSMPIEIRPGVPVEIGVLGAFGGFLILYYLMYFPLLLYHFATKDKDFFRSYGFVLSIFINLIALFGLFELIWNLLFDSMFNYRLEETGIIRISSIMRKSTRFAPFLVISLPLLISLLIEENRSKKWKIYLVTSISLSVVMLFMTSSRGALGAGVILWFFLFITLLANRTKKYFWQFLKITILLGSLLFIIGHILGISYFARFDTESTMHALEKREVKWEAYMDKVAMQQTSAGRSLANTLFGYGLFSERDTDIRDPHNTFISGFASFGVIGLAFYYIPYLWMFSLCLVRCFTARNIKSRPAHAMVCALILMFIASGYVHNKLYSPIESAYTWLLISFLLRNEIQDMFSFIRPMVKSPVLNAYSKSYLYLKRS